MPPPSIFYFFLNSEMRRTVVRGTLKCPGANYVLYGADQLPAQDFEVHHNMEETPASSLWVSRVAWLSDQAIRMMGGSGGDFQTVLQERRRCRQADIVVSTVDNVGVPLAYLNFFGLLRRPLLYISIGLPERIASIKSPMTRAFYRLLFRRIPRFTAYGWDEALWIRNWLGLPPESDRVVTFIPFGVDHLAFAPMPEARPESYILSAGADTQRDFQLLLQVAKLHPGVSFRVITSPHHAATFTDVPPHVQVLTHVPFAEFRNHLAGARLIVLPCHENTYSGGTTTLLQAMAMAKPVVVSQTGAIRDGYQLENNVNCRLVTPGSLAELDQAVQELCANPAACRAMGTAARKTVERHLTWDHYVQRLTTILLTTRPKRS